MEEIYLDASALYDSELSIDTIVTTFKRILDNGNIVFLPFGLANNPFVSGENIACMIYANAPISNPETGEYTTLGEDLLSKEASGKILPRITKEEFYHIPQDEIWTLNTQDDYKTAWDKLYPLVERYGADYINENKLSLAPWYKSLRINGFGANNIIEYYVDIREDDEFIKNESIGFDNFALIRKEWNDGRVTFDFVEYEG